MVSTPEVMQTKITKFELNMGRFDSFMNADNVTDVTVDVGTVPSLKKAIEIFYQTEGGIYKALWSELNAVVGSYVGQKGVVTGPDAGTHTDPVVGGTVANTGEFSWSAAPAGWKRLGARVDTSEITDMRTDIDGNTYGNAGERVDAMEVKVNRLDYAFPAEVIPGYVWNFFGPFWESPFGIKESGVVEIQEIEILGTVKARYGAVNDLDIPDVAHSMVDAGFASAVDVLEDGTARSAEFQAFRMRHKDLTVGADPTITMYFDYSINHSLIDGQSLSKGAFSYIVLSRVQKFDSLMPQGGVMLHTPDDSAAYADSMVPLVETGPGAHEDTGLYAETPASGLADMYKLLIRDVCGIEWNEFQHQVLATCIGVGGQSIAQLNTLYLTPALDHIDDMAALAAAAGDSYGVSDIDFIHGEQDNSIGTAVATYKTGVLTRYNAFNDKMIGAPYNQVRPIHWFMSQTQQSTGVSRTQRAVFELAKENPTFMHLVCPLYFLDYYLDNVHLESVSSRILGAYFAVAKFYTNVLRQNWSPLWITGHAGIGTPVLELTLNPKVPPIRIDTDRISTTDLENYGFDPYEPDNATPVVLNRLPWVSHPAGKIRLERASGNWQAGSTIHYADENGTTATTRKTGQRGCIRDSQGKKFWLPIDDGWNFPLHNWMVHHSGTGYVAT